MREQERKIQEQLKKLTREKAQKEKELTKLKEEVLKVIIREPIFAELAL
ncbi:MAG: hypothetical protein LBU04_01495 [Christensenellaceae bacterium]|nr:hypothetical protein [Christensenellaceae bacterium]